MVKDCLLVLSPELQDKRLPIDALRAEGIPTRPPTLTQKRWRRSTGPTDSRKVHRMLRLCGTSRLIGSSNRTGTAKQSSMAQQHEGEAL